MKKQFVSIARATMSGKFFKTAAFILVLSTSAVYANAQAIATSNKVAAENKSAVIRYLETENEMVVFQVEVENAASERFSVIVRDGDGSTVFNESYTTKNFSKRFKLPKDSYEKLTFIVKSPAGNQSETYTINSNVRYVEELVVKKVI